MNAILTKDHWLMAQQCLGMAWHALRAEPTPPDEATRFRMQQGQEVHALARELFPGGVFVPGGDTPGWSRGHAATAPGGCQRPSVC